MATKGIRGTYELGKAIVKAGILTEEQLNKTERIVIDIRAGFEPVRIYIQQLGENKQMSHLASMLPDLIDKEDVSNGE